MVTLEIYRACVSVYVICKVQAGMYTFSHATRINFANDGPNFQGFI